MWHERRWNTWERTGSGSDTHRWLSSWVQADALPTGHFRLLQNTGQHVWQPRYASLLCKCSVWYFAVSIDDDCIFEVLNDEKVNFPFAACENAGSVTAPRFSNTAPLLSSLFNSRSRECYHLDSNSQSATGCPSGFQCVRHHNNRWSACCPQ